MDPVDPVEWLLDLDDGRVVPWRNGRGTTRELLRWPDTDDWDWRASVATSDGPAPFSVFAGVDRELRLLTGTALELRFPDATVTLRPGERHRFAGELPVTGTPRGGPTTQLNLMWRRDRVSVTVLIEPLRVRVAPVDAPATLSPDRKRSD